MPAIANTLPTEKAHYKYEWETVPTPFPFHFLLHYSCFINDHDRDTQNAWKATMRGGDHWMLIQSSAFSVDHKGCKQNAILPRTCANQRSGGGGGGRGGGEEAETLMRQPLTKTARALNK